VRPERSAATEPQADQQWPALILVVCFDQRYHQLSSRDNRPLFIRLEHMLGMLAEIINTIRQLREERQERESGQKKCA
jgi:hypothetical protein